MTSEAKLPIVNPEIAGSKDHRRVRSWPVAPWVESQIQAIANTELNVGSLIAEIGIGAGSYARALKAPAAIRITIDLPIEQTAQPWQCPLASDTIDLLLSVDALHYEADIDHFVTEAVRVTKPSKLLLIFARSRENLKSDGLARFFPTAVERALPLLTEIPVLQKLLSAAGMECEQHNALNGNLHLDETLLRAIAHRELTGLGSLTDNEFNAGVERLKTAIAHGDTAWPAHFTMLTCRKATH